MNPARGLPFRSQVKSAKFALLNLSRTQMDNRFSVRNVLSPILLLVLLLVALASELTGVWWIFLCVVRVPGRR